MFSFIVVVAFVLGFFLGVYERKYDGMKVRFRNKSGSEVLGTPSPEEVEKENDKLFYDEMV